MTFLSREKWLNSIQSTSLNTNLIIHLNQASSTLISYDWIFEGSTTLKCICYIYKSSHCFIILRTTIFLIIISSFFNHRIWKLFSKWHEHPKMSIKRHYCYCTFLNFKLSIENSFEFMMNVNELWWIFVNKNNEQIFRLHFLDLLTRKPLWCCLQLVSRSVVFCKPIHKN